MTRPMPVQGHAPAPTLRRVARNRRPPWSTRRTGPGRSAPRRPCRRSIVLVHEPTSMVATALPEKLVTARASDMNRSMPTIRPTPSSRSGRWAWSPPARVASPAPLTPAAPLRGDDHEHQQRDLLADGQRLAHRVGDEQRRHRQVDRRAVQVERVAGRDDDAHRRLLRRQGAPSSRSAGAAPTPTTRWRRSAGTRGPGSEPGGRSTRRIPRAAARRARRTRTRCR